MFGNVALVGYTLSRTSRRDAPNTDSHRDPGTAFDDRSGRPARQVWDAHAHEWIKWVEHLVGKTATGGSTESASCRSFLIRPIDSGHRLRRGPRWPGFEKTRPRSAPG